ncbi:hypothetical protein VKT23_007924 [Stygiomarasmius scandens]|uniref:Uncharacterized protein n=1 Tax=Marasmiellus scandens TaxID=2682957 RepID=A0ABR1JN20_9AGAR
MLQYALRVIFYDPALFSKAIDKVSIEDFLLHPDFTLDDMYRFLAFEEQKLDIGLPWLKESIVEACAITPSDSNSGGNAINIEDSQISVLEGQISDRRHEGTMTRMGGE